MFNYCYDRGTECENAGEGGMCMSTACTKLWVNYHAAKIQAVDTGVKPYYDNFSLIEWHTDFKDVPADTEVLIIIKDDRGDSPSYYTQLAWVVNDGKLYTNPIWISNNEQIYDEVIMWAKLPKYEDIKRF